MKALSIRQPWAWLIVHGHKPVENRRWLTRYRGRFVVHAGRTFDVDGMRWILERGLVPADFPGVDALLCGGFVGFADLVDVRAPHFGRMTPWCDPEQYRFVLERPRPVTFVPCTGRLGFFTPSAIALAKLEP